MIAIIESYIHHKTGKEVRISKPRTPQQFLKLTKAYESCYRYFIKN